MAYAGEELMGRLDFVLDGSMLTIEHTRVFESYEGQGVGGELVKATTDYAAEHGLVIKPVCTYAVAWYKRHPEYHDMLAQGE